MHTLDEYFKAFEEWRVASRKLKVQKEKTKKLVEEDERLWQRVKELSSEVAQPILRQFLGKSGFDVDKTLKYNSHSYGYILSEMKENKKELIELLQNL